MLHPGSGPKFCVLFSGLGWSLLAPTFLITLEKSCQMSSKFCINHTQIIRRRRNQDRCVCEFARTCVRVCRRESGKERESLLGRLQQKEDLKKKVRTNGRWSRCACAFVCDGEEN